MHANHVYDEIVQHLRCTDRILILGPGAAKHRLHQKITDLQGRRGKVVEVRNAHEMTERELVRRAEDRFGEAVRNPGGSPGSGGAARSLG